MFISPSEEIADKIMISGMIEPVETIQNLPKEHYDNIANILTLIVRDITKESKKFTIMHICRLFNEINMYFNKNNIHASGLRPSDSIIRLQLCLIMNQGVITTLCKNDYMKIAEEVIDELFHTRLFDSDSDDFVVIL